MWTAKTNFRVILLILLIFFIVWLSWQTEIVELYYVQQFYSHYADSLRIFLGWIPFSIGDMVYISIILMLGVRLARWLKKIFGIKSKVKEAGRGILKCVYYVCWCWCIFQIVWGLNYHRKNIASQFDFTIEKEPSQKDLEELAYYFLHQTNRFAAGRKNTLKTMDETKKDIQSAYQHVSKEHPFIAIRHLSIKSSLFGVIGNYMGYGGYYNPLTGEAQINRSMPAFTIPFTSFHEVAHQLGYAKENEANFVGYLASMHSSDSSVQYAANLEMFLYANGAIAKRDTTLARKMMSMLHVKAKEDLREYDRFIKKYAGPVDRMTNWFYTRFLKMNNQPEGMRTYSRVTSWLLGYLKKNRYIGNHSLPIVIQRTP